MTDLRVSALPWLAVTLLAYLAAREIHRRSGRSPLATPILLGVILVAGLLLLTRTPYQTYYEGARSVHLLLGPATVAMAIPRYGQIDRLRRMTVPLALALVLGSGTAIGSGVGIGWLCGASPDVLLSLAPKSATMPIAMGVTERLGGVPSLTALTVTLTGIAGAIMARGWLDRLGIADPAVRGFAVGVTAHGIGTAQALEAGEVAGAFAALGMGLNAVATALLVPLLIGPAR